MTRQLPRRVAGGIALRLIGQRTNVHPRDVAAFIHPTRESAQGYVNTNRDEYGHPTWGPVQTESGWLDVVDLRRALADHDIDPTDPALPDDWKPA